MYHNVSTAQVNRWFAIVSLVLKTTDLPTLEVERAVLLVAPLVLHRIAR